MSSSIGVSLTYIGQQITIYCGIPIVVTGLLGGLLNIIIFLSLKTFRQSSCAFYLTIISIVNISQLFAGLLSRIMITGFSIDWTQASLFYCKFRSFLLNISNAISFTCLCLATLDQYFATSSHVRWQQWSNVKLAQRITGIVIIIWILHGIPYLLYYNHVISPSTDQVTCTITNMIFTQYRAYFGIPIMTGFLPILISILFGLLAYRNVQTIAHRTLPLVRRALDKQLTIMVLLHVIINNFVTLPYVIMNAFTSYVPLTNDSIISAQIQLAAIITLMLNYASLGSPFYIYICVSERFRRQLIFVLSRIYLVQWQHGRVVNNQVQPEL